MFSLLQQSQSPDLSQMQEIKLLKLRKIRHGRGKKRQQKQILENNINSKKNNNFTKLALVPLVLLILGRFSIRQIQDLRKPNEYGYFRVKKYQEYEYSRKEKPHKYRYFRIKELYKYGYLIEKELDRDI